ncbi:hypothetical protein BKA70DRAFT_1424207 [Coprinopsis sp. MPI-PUGE-AT-0042]|nr:hypothetical protein BKA70DRAFT_1424207 [Coprinopsis sp. MPI-PUGE-AT-0042]
MCWDEDETQEDRGMGVSTSISQAKNPCIVKDDQETLCIRPLGWAVSMNEELEAEVGTLADKIAAVGCSARDSSHDTSSLPKPPPKICGLGSTATTKRAQLDFLPIASYPKVTLTPTYPRRTPASAAKSDDALGGISKDLVPRVANVEQAKGEEVYDEQQTPNAATITTTRIQERTPYPAGIDAIDLDDDDRSNTDLGCAYEGLAESCHERGREELDLGYGYD